MLVTTAPPQTNQTQHATIKSSETVQIHKQTLRARQVRFLYLHALLTFSGAWRHTHTHDLYVHKHTWQEQYVKVTPAERWQCLFKASSATFSSVEMINATVYIGARERMMKKGRKRRRRCPHICSHPMLCRFRHKARTASVRGLCVNKVG